jgi:ectoine hydroxylase-related dioxygenase (phytanoyl-CoA dioxygenase family)
MVRISEGIRRAMAEDGYVVLPNGLRKESVHALEETTRAVFAAHSLPGEDIHQTCVRLSVVDKPLLYRIYQYSQSNLAMDRLRQACFAYAKSFLPEQGFYLDIDSHVIMVLPNDQRLSWGWHQESSYHPEVSHSVGFWFPLFEPSTVENGTMSVLKGSHRLGRLPYTRHKSASDSATTLLPDNIEALVTRYSEEYCLLEPGDVLMFHMDLVHRSNANTSERPRFTGLIRLAQVDRIPSTYGKTV